MIVRPRIACDTNVLVSAFIANGPPGRVIEEAATGKFDFVLLDPTMVELLRILAGKLAFPLDRLEEVQELLASIATENWPKPEGEPEAVTGDPDDDLVLACAVDAGVSVLVSGDRKHLVPVGEHAGVRILTPQAFLAELRQ